MNLEKARSALASKHAQGKINLELQQKQNLKERQQVFEEAFHRDLEVYKSLGEIPSMCRFKYFYLFSTKFGHKNPLKLTSN